MYGVSRNTVMSQTLNSSSHVYRHQLEIEVLASISSILAIQSGQEEMLSLVLSELERTLGFSNCISMLLSMDGSKLIVEATREGHLTRNSDLSYLTGEGITGTVAQTGRPAIVPRVSREPKFRNRVYRRPLGEGHDMGFVCVPVVLSNEVVGTLSADVPQETVGDLDEHARFLGIVAGLIAFDMKSRRISQLERRNIEAENYTEKSTLLSNDGVLNGHNLSPKPPMSGTDRESQVVSLPERVKMLEKDMIIGALKSTRGNVAAAARRLGISARMARYKIHNLNIEVKRILNTTASHDG